MLNRRAFLCAVPVVAATAVIQPVKSSRKWGAVDVERHFILRTRGIDLHVFHDGKDITKDCRFADDELDYAEVFLRDERGRAYLDKATGCAAMATVRGIEIRQA